MSRLLVVAVCGLMLFAVPAGAAVRAVGPTGVPLPDSFAGISVETNVVPDWFDAKTCASPARDALKALGHPELRIGGNSQDRLWPNQPLPVGQKQVAQPAYFHALHCLDVIHSPMLIGLNLLGRDADSTGALLAAVSNAVRPEDLRVAIGNEPNLYGSRLPSPGDYAGYLKLYGKTIDTLRGRLGGFLPPIAGPDPATWRWTKQTADFVRDALPAMVDEHVYGLNGCRQTPGDTTYPTIKQLLTPAASTDLIEQLRPVVRAARSAQIPAEITETNSVACSGIAGISDTPASALWALTLLGSAAQTGFARVDFHSSLGAYDPFVLDRGKLEVRPLFSAMVLANEQWPAGTRPMHVRGPVPSGLSVFAGKRIDGTTALLVVNRSRTRSRVLTVQTPATHATVGRLLRANSHAVTLDGRRAEGHGKTLRWVGTQHLAHPIIKHDRVRISVRRESAVWIRLRP